MTRADEWTSGEDNAWRAAAPHLGAGQEMGYRAGFQDAVNLAGQSAKYWRDRFNNEYLTGQGLQDDILDLARQVEEYSMVEEMITDEYEARLKKRNALLDAFVTYFDAPTGPDDEEPFPIRDVLEEYRTLRLSELVARMAEDEESDNDISSVS